MDEISARLNKPLLQRIASRLPGDQTTYLVGGAIRDALLNRSFYDLDFVTPDNALKIAREVANELGGAYFPLDTRRKVARIVFIEGDQSIERSGKLTRVDFSTFQGEDLTADLKGRDFTINAIAAEIHRLETLIDPLGGTTDLISKRLVACSPTALVDDPVRVLRAVRFSVDLDLSITPFTHNLIREATSRLPEVSVERLRDELFRILIQSQPSTSLRILERLGALEHILPEVCLLKGVEQSSPHVLDAFEHTLALLSWLENILQVVVGEYDPDRSGNLAMGLAAVRLGRYREQLQEHFEFGLNPERSHRGLLFLAGLFHDAGKAATQKVDEEGKIRFTGHEQIGSKLIEKRGKALKLSNNENERLVTIVKHHMRPSLLSHENDMPSRKAIYRFFRDTGAAGVDICILSLADMLATYGPTLPQERWARHLDVIRSLLDAWWTNKPDAISPAPLLGGDDLMSILNLPPGPEIGNFLEAIREAQAAGEINSREEAINLAKDLQHGK